MGDDFSLILADAERRGRQSLVDEPRVETVRHDPSSGGIIAEPTNGRGYALRWEKLNVDLSAPGLLAV